MNRKDLFNSFNEIDESLLERSETARKNKIPIWHKWGVLASCFCLTAFIITTFCIIRLHRNKGNGTLPGAEEIYPTVMVNDKLYEWYKGEGNAIYSKLPDDCKFYGEIYHTKEIIPKNNCGFASVFDVSGEIYTTSSNNFIYLKLTTSWTENTVVKFELINDVTGEKLIKQSQIAEKNKKNRLLKVSLIIFCFCIALIGFTILIICHKSKQTK